MKSQKSFQNETPTLYLVPTPIGNLQEMTPRAIDVLKNADRIAAEDTRNAHKLCQIYGIDTPIVSHHEHNQKKSIPEIVQMLQEGYTVALVSDAGYPLVSDPGQSLVEHIIDAGFHVVSVSGANAAMNALVASGLPVQPYLFYGFTDANSNKRIRELETLKTMPYTMIFYEAPHRIDAMLRDCLSVFGNRRMVLARELTKVHEEYLRGTLQELIDSDYIRKGEMVVLIEGYRPEEKEVDWEAIFDAVDAYKAQGYRTKEAISKAAYDFSVKKNEVYQGYHQR